MSPVSWGDIFTLLLGGDRIMELRQVRERALRRFARRMYHRGRFHQVRWNMKRIALLFIATLGCANAAAAQDWARERLEKSPRHREWATVKRGDRAVETFVAYPEGKTMEAVSHLNPEQIIADLNAVADYALKLPAASGKLFVAGFCWGGGQTFRFATNRGDLAAAFVFYGPPPEKDAMARIKAPVYGFYGGNDARIDATIPDTIANMKAAGKTYEPVTYEAAGHGFMRASEAPDANDANKKARADAWVRWKNLMGKEL